MHLRAPFLAVCILLPLSAQAMDSDLDNIRWNGFLNVVGGIAKEDPFSPTNIDGLYSDSSNTTALSFDRETSAALQAVKPLDAETSVTLQVLSKGSVENYQARMSWLYLSHAISDTQSLRVGRLGLQLYYYSDFLNVGYAYHWISPPGLVYPFDANFTGVDYVHRGVLGASTGLQNFSTEHRMTRPTPFSRVRRTTLSGCFSMGRAMSGRGGCRILRSVRVPSSKTMMPMSRLKRFST